MFGYYNPQNYIAVVNDRIDELNRKVVLTLQYVQNLEQELLSGWITIPNGDWLDTNCGQHIADLRQDVNTLLRNVIDLSNLIASLSRK
jgi:hypothetical protein